MEVEGNTDIHASTSPSRVDDSHTTNTQAPVFPFFLSLLSSCSFLLGFFSIDAQSLVDPFGGSDGD